MIPVTLVTRDATLDDLSASDYRDIFDEVRIIDPKTQKRISLDKFVELIGSAFSKALWSKYDHEQIKLNRNQRNELRKAVGLPALPPTVAEATAAASPDAAVWSVGDGPAENVVMIGAQEHPITISVNGAVSVSEDARTDSHVTEVTRPRRDRPPLVRPIASQAQNQRRLAISATWNYVIEKGLAACELEALEERTKQP